MAEDKTFTDKDVIRIYCNNLSGFERASVRAWFKDTGGDCSEINEDDEDRNNRKRIVREQQTIREGMTATADLSINPLAFLAGFLFGDNEDTIKQQQNISDLYREKIKLRIDKMVDDAGDAFTQNLRIAARAQRLRISEEKYQIYRENFRAELSYLSSDIEELDVLLGESVVNNAKNAIKVLQNASDISIDYIEQLENSVVSLAEYLGVAPDGN